MKTPNAIPIFLVCLLAVLAEGANTSLTNSHARRSIERNHHNHQRHAHSEGRRLDGSYVASELRRTEAKRLDLDDVAKIADAIGLPAPPGGSTTDSATSTSTTDTTSSTASSTDSASSTSVTDTASSTSVSTTDSATSTASSTSSASSSVSTDSTSASDSATSTESATSTVSVTDSATSTVSVSDSGTATVTDAPTSPAVSDPPPTQTVTDPPPTSASDSATATVTDPPATTPTVSDPPATSTKTECDPLDIVCIGSTILFPSSTPTSDSQVSTPAPTSDPPQTDSSTATATVSDPPATTSDPPSSTSDIVSDIVNTLSSLLPTDSATQTFSDLPTQTETATQSDRPTDTVTQSDRPTDTVTQSDKPTDTQTQSDQPTQTDTSSGTQTISQPPPTITDSFSVTDSFSNTNTRTITGSDSPTDSATESATRTESVSFPTLTDSPTDSQPTATATDSSASDSITDSVSMTMTTEPIPSEYSYITDQSLALTSLPATSTLALTLTDPDAAFTTASLTQSGTAAPSQAVAFPTQLPTRIFPANRLDPDDPSLDGMVLVSLKFLSSLTWAFVVNNSNTAALLFVYTPQAIANALGISTDQVKTFAMQAFAPADYSGDISQLSTVYLLYIPADQVDALQQQLLAQNSPLYTNQAGIPKQISQQLDATFPVNAVGLDTAIVGTGNTANGNNAGAADASAASRRDAIIGVCAAFGVILLAVVAWWVYKSWKRRQDRAHRRLTHDSAGMHQAGGYGATTQSAYGTVYGAAPQRSGYAQPHTPMYTTSGAPIANPFEDSSYEEDPDERRRSFFYAEDSLRGFTVPREEDQGITYTQLRHQQQGLMPNDGKRRAPIQASAISAPILRESSLNW